jgi:type 2 lantibiotic biosynthesis protein LanM
MASLTPEERRAILVRAATIYERVAETPAGENASDRPAAPSPPDVSAALRAWNQAFSPGNAPAFLRRLGWDGLSWNACIGALTSEPLDGSAAQDWTCALDLVLEQARNVFVDVSAGALAEIGWLAGDNEPPFVELLVPVSRAARARLDRLQPGVLDRFSGGAQRTLEIQLLRELSPLTERALFQLFEQSTGGQSPADGQPPGDARYRAFVLSMLDGGISTLFLAYPVLARAASRLVDTWVATTHELARRLESDRAEIARQFFDGTDPGNVAAIKPGLSDPHHGRRRVSVLTFASGVRLVYKPRDVGLERALSDFVEWANQRGLHPTQRQPLVLERMGYGWIEFVQRHDFGTTGEVAEYYRRAGGLVAIAHLLGGADLHMENIVATAQGPAIVDAESLLQPSRTSTGSMPADHGPVTPDPCVATGMVSFAEVGAGGERFETGGLRGEGFRGSSRPRRTWEHVRTDALRFSTGQEFFAPSENRVLRDGAVQKPEEFGREMAQGYAATHRFFAAVRDEVLASRGPLSGFSGRRARVMFRATNQYASLQDVLAAPKYQAGGVARSAAMDILARPFASEPSKPVAWPLVVEERLALERFDIPHFTTGTDDAVVYAGDRPVEGRFFVTPGLELVRRRFERLSEDDLDVQLAWLARSLSESATSRFRTPLSLPAASSTSEEPDRDRQALALATWIGHELLARATESDDVLTWTLNQPGTMVTTAEAHFLYAGSLGPAVFLAALGRVSGDGSWTDAARRAALPARRLTERADLGRCTGGEPIGAGSGLMSLAYGLSLVGAFAGDQSYDEAAARVLNLIDDARITNDRYLDILSGSAGAILAALALPRNINRRVLDVAAACGEHLVARQLHTHWGSNWPSHDGRLLAGFGHGAAGIAYALVRLYEATGAGAFKDAALRAHRYERAVFSPLQKNWPVVRSAGHLPGNVSVAMTAWCHGAPGIALARALVSGIVGAEDPEIAGELEVALTSTAVLDTSGSDHVCCGNLGRAGVLLTAGRALGRQGIVEAARTIASGVQKQAVERGRFQLVSNGFEHLVFDAGFFQGLSGIGYELLRMAAPSRLPSVLAFEGAN